MAVKLMINGDAQAFHGDPRTSLLQVLRETYRLTGAKPVCNEGFCGACTVHIDGVPKAACLQPVGLLDGARITTIEGVATVDRLNAVQQALETFDAVQCGMCFPGMVMTLSAFIETNPAPTRAEIKNAMTGNLCRCTGYERIIDAVMSLQDKDAAQQEAAK